MSTPTPPFTAPDTAMSTCVDPLPTPVDFNGRRLLITGGPANLSLRLVWGAVPGVLLALQVQEQFGDEHKVGILALVTTVGAIAAMLFQPVAGMISDRTRSRFGRRAPWIVLGALSGGLALVALAFADTLATLMICWVTVQIGFNFSEAALSAILPDRVPHSARGVFSAVIGLASMFGSLGGQVFAAKFSENIPAAYLMLAGFAIVMMTLFVVLNPDASSSGLAVEPFKVRSFIASLWVSPARYPDFFWTIVSRLFTYSGYFIVFGYKLYILQDYIGLGKDAISFVPVVGLVSLAGVTITSLIAGRLSDRLGRRKIFIGISASTIGIALAVPLFMPNTLGMLIMAGIGGLGFGCFQAIDTALISEVLPSDRSYGKDLGIVNIAVILPQILAPAIAGAIVTVSGGYSLLFPLGALFGILGAVSIVKVRSIR
jgi:MFS family permease